MEERDETFTWGQIVGSQFGEANAQKALARGDVKTKVVTAVNGDVHRRYAIKTFMVFNTILCS